MTMMLKLGATINVLKHPWNILHNIAAMIIVQLSCIKLTQPVAIMLAPMSSRPNSMTLLLPMILVRALTKNGENVADKEYALRMYP